MLRNQTEINRNKTRSDLILFFILAYAISWAIAIPLALQKHHITQPVLPYWAHYFVGYGPMLSALFVTWYSEGFEGLRKIGKNISAWNIHPRWWFIAISPLLLGIAIALFMNLFSGEKITISHFGMVNFLPPLGIGAFFLWLFTFGFGEEVGWRGYVLPRLQKKYNALMATTILTLFWAIWHLPQFFYLFAPAIAVGWAVGLFAGAVVFTWIFNSTNGSILLVALFHGSFNFVTAANINNNIPAVLVSSVVMVWALFIIVHYKPKTLSIHKRVCDN